jgi:mono/diheme cytochrome c family protein
MPPSKKIAALLRSPIKFIHCFAVTTVGATVVAFVLPTLAQSAEPWVAPTEAAAKKNPFAGQAAAAAAGKQIFTTTCAPCHGTTGRGDGPAAAALNPRPANYTTSAISGESDGSLFWKLSEGRGAMVAFKSSLSEKQRWELITYIRTLQGKN